MGLLPEGSLGHPHTSICQSNLDHHDPETLFSEDAGSEQQACRGHNSPRRPALGAGGRGRLVKDTPAVFPDMSDLLS